MPLIIEKSVSILSDAGLGMAMFTIGKCQNSKPFSIFDTFRKFCSNDFLYSTGLFMALQPSLIPCGKARATYAMLVRFIAGPAVMAAAALILGIRGQLLEVSIVQVRYILHVYITMLISYTKFSKLAV